MGFINPIQTLNRGAQGVEHKPGAYHVLPGFRGGVTAASCCAACVRALRAFGFEAHEVRFPPTLQGGAP